MVCASIISISTISLEYSFHYLRDVIIFNSPRLYILQIYQIDLLASNVGKVHICTYIQKVYIHRYQVYNYTFRIPETVVDFTRKQSIVRQTHTYMLSTMTDLSQLQTVFHSEMFLLRKHYIYKYDCTMKISLSFPIQHIPFLF